MADVALNLKRAFPLLSTIKVCKENRNKTEIISEKNRISVNKTNCNKS